MPNDSIKAIPDSLGAVPDSVSNIESSVFDSFQEYVMQANSMVYSFWLSVIAIFLIYFFKTYLIKILPVGEKLLPALMEFLIDVCVTLIPIIAVGSFNASKGPFGMFLVMASIVIVLLCTFFRKKWGDCYTGDKKCANCYMIACVFVCIFYIFTIYHYISKTWI